MNEKFKVLKLKQELLQNLDELKFENMTPIQANALPLALDGDDVIAQAKTGSGKTAVFGLSILNSIDPASFTTQSLIICPTRELAEQVAKEIRSFARKIKDVKILTLCGGTGELHQERSLQYGAHIIVGTPGRILKLLKKDFIKLSSIKSFILDEADRLLDMGFQSDILEIVTFLPSPRQTMLFSATFPDKILDLSKNIQSNAIEVKIDTEHKLKIIDQTFYEVKSHKDKDAGLLKIINFFKPERLIVFCKTKQFTENVAKFLNKQGICAAAINGDLDQNERTSVLIKFSNRSLSVLVATDVAARGLDIQELEAVINYDLPTDPEMYVHRIGRTGRAGKTGLAFSLFVDKGRFVLDNIEKFTGRSCKIEYMDELVLDDTFTLVPPMKTIYISGGKKDKLRPGDILGALIGVAQLDPKDVGEISILNIVSFVAIKKDLITDTIEKLRSGKIKNRKFKVGLA